MHRPLIDPPVRRPQFALPQHLLRWAASPAFLTLAYALLALTWIALSDRAAAQLFGDVASMASFQTAKGEVFVLATALFLFVALTWTRGIVLQVPRIEALLRDASAQVRLLVRHSPDAILLHAGGRVVYSNPAFNRAVGLPPRARLAGTRLANLVAPEDRERVEQRLARLEQHEGVASPAAVRIRTLDRRVLEWEHLSCSRRFGGQMLVQSHFRDLGPRNAARRELEALNSHLDELVRQRTAALAEANAALESFTHSVAHDLRSPLGQVQGFAGAIECAAARGDRAKVEHYAQRMAAGARTMQQMLEGLLQLSQAGRGELESRPVDTAATVADVLESLDMPHHAELVVGELAPMRGDARLLRQVWANLIGNALKYSARNPAPRIDIGCDRGERETTWWVRDNGIGFELQESERLFGVFSRLTSAAGYSGTGVGLSIVARIVRRHGGRVAATGEPGRGAVFSFTLPA